MKKLKFKEKLFKNIINENFSAILSKNFVKCVFDKKRNRLLLLGGSEITNWNKESALFSVFNKKLYQSLEKLNNYVYLHGNKKVSNKYRRTDMIIPEILNSEIRGNKSINI